MAHDLSLIKRLARLEASATALAAEAAAIRATMVDDVPQAEKISLAEAARITGFHERTIRRDVAKYGFGSLVGDRWQVDRQAAVDWANAKTQNVAAGLPGREG